VNDRCRVSLLHMNRTHRSFALASSSLLAVGVALLISPACKKGEESERATSEESVGKEQPAQQVVCGKATCAAGEVCCNPSCGICTAPDGMCTQQFCDEEPAVSEGGDHPPPPAALTACDTVRCAGGTHCELVQVQCVRAPCDPVPQCVGDADASTKR
jgi:hypothetical protein